LAELLERRDALCEGVMAVNALLVELLYGDNGVVGQIGKRFDLLWCAMTRTQVLHKFGVLVSRFYDDSFVPFA